MANDPKSRAHGRVAVSLAVWLCFAPGGSLAADASTEASASPTQRLGALLRAANEHLAAGDRVAGEELLAEIADDPTIGDHAQILWMRSRVESGRSAEAIVMKERWERQSSPLVAEFYTLLGRAYAAEGAERAARDTWLRAIESEESSERQAELRRSIAASYGRSERYEEAEREYLEVWTQFPATDASAAAAIALESIEARFGRSLRTAAAYRRRGDALFRLLRNEAALEAYDRALASKPSPVERRRAERKRAQTLFRLRRYPEARLAYQQLPAEDETAIEIARTRARSGDVPRAIDELEAIGKRRNSRHAVRANYLAGLLADEKDPERARRFFEKTIARGGATSYALAAIWNLGWSAFREGRDDDAIGHFTRLIGSDKSLSSLGPRYWLARALERTGAASAPELYRSLADEYPLSYYGWRAAQRAPTDRSRPPFDATSSHPIEAGRVALTPRSIERAEILIAAGMTEAANAELTRLFVAASGLADRLVLAQLFSETGDVNRAQRLFVGAYDEQLARTPALRDLDVWWYAWPAPFSEGFRRAAESGVRVEPGLVYAVMREESGYLPKVRSVSGARGLMQIMPETGARLAARAALAGFDPDDLFDPEVNILLGSSYLEQLLERFDGRASAAVASYNAGPEAVSRWIASGPAEDDEWVEAIPYDQTRTYVKRVLRSLHVYRVLY